MQFEDSHLSDERLLSDIDGELAAPAAKQIQAHLAACWRCRTRRQELDQAIASFVRTHHDTLDRQLPSSTGPRAMLKAQLEQLSATQPSRIRSWPLVFRRVAWPALATVCLFLGWILVKTVLPGMSRTADPVVSMPDPKLTPGAAILASKQAVCSAANVKNKPVPVAVQRRVLQEYGIRNPQAHGYEVDYLVTPALGGSDDIRNLWPHSYTATAWNARVKDTLEDQLRILVCDGNLDLREAQQEISANWIVAYKKYFHTDAPLAQ
jgi:hypothetical protein